MIELTQTDLPEPVVPAISKWGICVRSAEMGAPSTLWPSEIASGESMLANCGDSMTSRRLTNEGASLGTSMPTNPLPGTGASTRMDLAPRASWRVFIELGDGAHFLRGSFLPPRAMR